MAGILFATCLMLAAAVASGAHGSPTPAPSSKPTDCSIIIYNMANCMPFLSKGGKDTKPDSSCCTGFKSVLKVNAECICEALKSSASLGLDLNMTKAVTLPSACGVSATAPPISKCGSEFDLWFLLFLYYLLLLFLIIFFFSMQFLPLLVKLPVWFIFIIVTSFLEMVMGRIRLSLTLSIVSKGYVGFRPINGQNLSTKLVY